MSEFGMLLYLYCSWAAATRAECKNCVSFRISTWRLGQKDCAAVMIDDDSRAVKRKIRKPCEGGSAEQKVSTASLLLLARNSIGLLVNWGLLLLTVWSHAMITNRGPSGFRRVSFNRTEKFPFDTDLITNSSSPQFSAFASARVECCQSGFAAGFESCAVFQFAQS